MSKDSPQQFGKYVLLRRIALGGMAEIFKAKVAGVEGFEKDLVIKRILPHFSDDETFVRMFVDEARITAKLQHPNIVQIFDFDVLDGSYFIAMEYIEGKDLKDLLEESAKQGDPLSVPQCVWLAIEIAKGLHYAHTKEDRGEPLRIVHRDVTPSNVMVSFRGDVKLMDFGIAKAAQRSTKTQAGTVKGKVAYMSPEQARGKHIDGRTDIFALGVMLWEMLTRTRLFMAESDFDTLSNVLRMQAPPPSSLNPRCPPELDPIVAKCLEKNAEDRWSSAEALGRELTRWYYSSVADLEKEKLRPLMLRLFKRDIDLLERQANEDDAFMSGSAAPKSESTAVEARRNRASAPVSEQATRMDAGAAGGARQGLPGRSTVHDDLTRSTIAHATSAAAQLREPRGSPLPWILLVLLLIGGGTAAVILATRGGSGGPTDAAPAVAGSEAPSAAANATLYIKVDPHTANVKVDGRAVDGEVSGLTVGQKVRIVAEAPGYKRFEEIIAIEDGSPVYPIKMEKEGIPHRIVIKPSNETDEVFVDGQRLGLGAQPFEGTVGQDIVVKIVRAAGGSMAQVVKIDAALGIVNIVTTGDEAAAKVDKEPAAKVDGEAAAKIDREPAAKVDREPAAKVDKEPAAKVDKEPAAKVDKEPAAKVDKEPAAKVDKEPAAKVDKEPAAKVDKEPAAKVDKEPAAARGKGSMSVSARPWAQVSINGRPYGTTPTQLKDLPAGSYTVVLTKGQQSITKSVQVAAGKQAQVFVDFTDM